METCLSQDREEDAGGRPRPCRARIPSRALEDFGDAPLEGFETRTREGIAGDLRRPSSMSPQETMRSILGHRDVKVCLKKMETAIPFPMLPEFSLQKYKSFEF